MDELYKSFKKSLDRLEEVLKQEKTIINRDAAIKRFEFTAELGWKTIQQFLRGKNINCQSPRSCLEEAFKFGLVEDEQSWLTMLNDRNLTVHTYNEEVAENVYKNLKNYLSPLKRLAKKLTSQ